MTEYLVERFNQMKHHNYRHSSRLEGIDMSGWVSGKVYRNRYGMQYWWEELSSNTYQFKMEAGGMPWMRTGAKEEDGLSFFDPAGGPFVTEGQEIDGHKITKVNEDLSVEVSNE